MFMLFKSRTITIGGVWKGHYFILFGVFSVFQFPFQYLLKLVICLCCFPDMILYDNMFCFHKPFDSFLHDVRAFLIWQRMPGKVV